MITMELLGKIRRMHVRDKMSVRAIAKRTGLSRNTLQKWLQAPEEVEVPKYVRAKGFSKLGAFVDELEQSLKADAHRHKQDRRTGKALFVQIKARGYVGSYSRVTDFIRQWRASEGKKPHAFVPLKFELGEAFQFDWGEEGMVVGGIYRRMQVSHMKLCASRAFWLVAYPSQGHEMLFDAHTRSFCALGGVARRGIYDNMWTWGFAKTAVDKVNATSPAAGRRGLSRRTCKTVAGASGLTHRRANGTPLKSSTPGWVSAAAPCGARSVIPSSSTSARSKCWGKSVPR